MTGVASLAPAVQAAAQALEQLLHRQIPLSRAMQIVVREVSEDRVRLWAPLAPNLNQHATVFGGSAAAAAILAAWSLLHVRLQRQSPAAVIVIQSQSMRYNLPIRGGFEACARLQDAGDWGPFLRLLQRRGKARIAITSTLEYGGVEAGQFSGDFVAFAEGHR
ncbi:MAG TPA: YiiD C-terminal domain-containing protein [Steroidobacteraceae bacterium]